MKITMNKIKEELSINTVFKKYENHMLLNSFSMYTVDLVKRCYKNFNLFLDDENFLINDITSDVIDNYILWLRKQENKNTTINIKLSDLRMFFYWAMDKEYLNKFKINLVKEEKSIRKTYSEKELCELLKKPNIDKCIFGKYRDWVIVNFLLGTGARSLTLLNIKIKDLDFDNYLITFTTTKNKTPIIVPMAINLSNVLSEYLSYRKGNIDEYLFCNAYGEQLTRAALKDAIRRYNLQRGVSTTSLHSYRHTFAKMFITNGGNLFVLQKLLGHKSIRSTQVYVNLLTSDLEKDYDKYNPLDVILSKNKKDIIKMK
jgi:integrase/recombinase XerD